MKLQVIVPLDGSPFAEQAIPHAVDIVAQTGGVLHLVKVHRPPEDSLLGDAMYMAGELIDEEVRDDDRHYLEQIAASPDVASVELLTTLLTGDVVGALSHYVQTCGIDLIVMSTHGRGGLSRAWLGSVAESLLRVTHVPALLLRPSGHESPAVSPPAAIRQILIPVDGSTLSETVIQTAITIGGRKQTRYTLLRVVVRPVAIAFADALVPVSWLTDELRGTVVKHLKSIAGKLTALGYSVQTAVAVGPDPADAIREYATERGFDLIAMATHGRAGLKRVLFGSVSDRVKRGTTVPVLMLQPEVQHANGLNLVDIN